MSAFTVVDGRITDIAAMVDPAKLAGAVVDDAAHLAHRALDRAGVLDDRVDGDADGVLDQGGEVGTCGAPLWLRKRASSSASVSPRSVYG
jgi:hypothetical protein